MIEKPWFYLTEVHLRLPRFSVPERLYPLVLVLLWALLTLPSLALTPLFDLDETVYAQAAADMLRGGNWIIPSVNGVPFFDKPPIVYYLMDVSFLIFGENSFSARLPSAIFTLMTALYLFYFGRTVRGPRFGLMAACVFLTTLEVGLLAHAAILDATLNFCLVLSILSYFLWNTRGIKRDAYLSALAAGAAVSVKGPVGVVIPVVVVALDGLLSGTLKAFFRNFPWFRGGVAFLAAALPWYGLVALNHTWGFFKDFILVHNIGRAEHPMEGHGGGWYYYLVVFAVSTLPWLACLPWAWRQTLQRWRVSSDTDALSRLAWLWMLAVMLMFTLAQTKLPQYISSIYAGVALGLAAEWYDAPPDLRTLRRMLGAAAVLVLPLASVLSALPRVYRDLPRWVHDQRALALLAQPIAPPWWISMIGLLLAAMGVGVFLSRGRLTRWALPTLIVISAALQTGLLTGIGVFGGRLIQGPLLVIADAIRHTPSTTPVFSLDLNYPSVSFYGGRPYTMLHGEKGMKRLAAARGDYLLVLRDENIKSLRVPALRPLVTQGGFTLLAHAADAKRERITPPLSLLV